MTCSVDSCDRPVSARGWCKRHYERWRIHGDPHHLRRADYGRGPHGEPLAAKLLRKSEPAPNGCREWTGYCDPEFGYGSVAVDGRMEKAHRMSWVVANGRPAPPGKVVRHKCDNPPCIEPSHLVLGTQAENVADMFVRKRADRNAEQNNSARLTWDSVRAIRAFHDEGASVRDLSSRFSVSKSQIRNVISYTHWKETA